MRKLTVALACLWLAPSPAPAETPTYTNADLERVAPRRAETGGENPPRAVEAAAPDRLRRDDSARDEKTWRAEARRVAEKVERLKEQAASLRERAAAEREREREAPLGRRAGGTRRSQAAVRLEEQARRAEERAAALESDLSERARRARALPGWLR